MTLSPCSLGVLTWRYRLPEPVSGPIFWGEVLYLYIYIRRGAWQLIQTKQGNVQNGTNSYKNVTLRDSCTNPCHPCDIPQSFQTLRNHKCTICLVCMRHPLGFPLESPFEVLQASQPRLRDPSLHPVPEGPWGAILGKRLYL